MDTSMSVLRTLAFARSLESHIGIAADRRLEGWEQECSRLQSLLRQSLESVEQEVRARLAAATELRVQLAPVWALSVKRRSLRRVFALPAFAPLHERAALACEGIPGLAGMRKAAPELKRMLEQVSHDLSALSAGLAPTLTGADEADAGLCSAAGAEAAADTYPVWVERSATFEQIAQLSSIAEVARTELLAAELGHASAPVNWGQYCTRHWQALSLLGAVAVLAFASAFEGTVAMRADSTDPLALMASPVVQAGPFAAVVGVLLFGALWMTWLRANYTWHVLRLLGNPRRPRRIPRYAADQLPSARIVLTGLALCVVVGIAAPAAYQAGYGTVERNVVLSVEGERRFGSPCLQASRHPSLGTSSIFEVSYPNGMKWIGRIDGSAVAGFGPGRCGAVYRRSTETNDALVSRLDALGKLVEQRLDLVGALKDGARETALSIDRFTAAMHRKPVQVRIDDARRPVPQVIQLQATLAPGSELAEAVRASQQISRCTASQTAAWALAQAAAEKLRHCALDSRDDRERRPVALKMWHSLNGKAPSLQDECGEEDSLFQEAVRNLAHFESCARQETGEKADVPEALETPVAQDLAEMPS